MRVWKRTHYVQCVIIYSLHNLISRLIVSESLKLNHIMAWFMFWSVVNVKGTNTYMPACEEIVCRVRESRDPNVHEPSNWVIEKTKQMWQIGCAKQKHHTHEMPRSLSSHVAKLQKSSVCARECELVFGFNELQVVSFGVNYLPYTRLFSVLAPSRTIFHHNPFNAVIRRMRLMICYSLAAYLAHIFVLSMHLSMNSCYFWIAQMNRPLFPVFFQSTSYIQLGQRDAL